MKLSKRVGLISLLLAMGISDTPTRNLEQPAQTHDTQDTVLFGVALKNTGLTREQCMPVSIHGEESWKVPVYDQEQRRAISSLTLINSPEPLLEDPYRTNSLRDHDNDAFCAVLIDEANPRAYTLMSYQSEQAAASAGAIITHRGSCGQCSSLQDLAVYMNEPALTQPARQCVRQGFFRGEDAGIECMQGIGFSQGCAQIWYFNARNTRDLCLSECLEALTSLNHDENGALNNCIRCDEETSGPIFKSVAGRTRRNSGLPSDICRPQDSVYRVEHNGYVQGSAR